PRRWRLRRPRRRTGRPSRVPQGPDCLVGRRSCLSPCHPVTGSPGAGSTSTSQFLEVSIPVPSVSDPIRRQVGGPYGTKIIPRGTFPSWQRKVASPPYSDRTRTVPPGATPRAFKSSGCRIRVFTIARYSSSSLPTLICWPCLLVRPAFMMKRLPAIRLPLSNCTEIPFTYVILWPVVLPCNLELPSVLLVHDADLPGVADDDTGHALVN